MFKRLASLTLIAVTLLLSGCARHISSTTEEFSAAKKMVVTMRDGETLTGRFEIGEQVRYVTFGKVYRGTIEDKGPPNIILKDVYLEAIYDRQDVQRTRLEGSDLKVTDESDRLFIPRHKVLSVEEITMDRQKTTRGFFFWTFTSIILGSIISTRF